MNPYFCFSLMMMVAAAAAAPDHFAYTVKEDPKENLEDKTAFHASPKEPIGKNFVSSTTQLVCSNDECGCIGSCRQGEHLDSFFDPIDNIILGDNDNDDKDNDYFVHGYDGSGGFNYLTSTSTAPLLCPSKVEFDFSLAFAAVLRSGRVGDRTLTLQVIDDKANDDDTIIFSIPIPSATIQKDHRYTKRKNHVNVNLVGEGFFECLSGAKLRFAWDIPESPGFLDGSNPSAGQFVFDNLSVTPLSTREVQEILTKSDSLSVDAKIFQNPNIHVTMMNEYLRSIVKPKTTEASSA